MKKFMERYSYESVHLFLNQVAIGLFGMTLALAAGMADNDALRTATSVFATAFFLFLQFITILKVGAQDRLSSDLSRSEKNYLIPVWMWLLSNSLNLLLALFISLSMWFDVPALSTIGGIASVIKLIIEGMYTGMLAISVGGAPLNSMWFMYFITTLPALVILVLGYVLGFNNVTLKKKK